MGQVAWDLVRIGRKSGSVVTYVSIGTCGPKGTFCLIGAFFVIGTYRSVGTYTPEFRNLLLYCRVFTRELASRSGPHKTALEPPGSRC
jgi:hypothetical protein